jgi:N-formylglutamate deformylase
MEHTSSHQDGAHLKSSWVIHLPHASTIIPATVRPELLLSDQDLALEVLRMTDHLTDKLVATALSTAQRVRFPVSRLVLDPERFAIDADEPMSRVGMGVIYERTSHGAPLRLPLAPAARQRLLETYYAPHHASLEASVASALERYGRCSILDTHSFPSRPLPYELDQSSDRPDICIGTDEFHTPAPLADEFVRRFSAEALAVARNRPFSGTIVPMRYFRNDRRVMSVMIEVNRRLYLDEATGKAGKRFGHVQSTLARVLEAVVDMPTSISCNHLG